MPDQITTEQFFKSSEFHFRYVADHIPTLVWVANTDGWIYWYNRSWYEFTGTTPEQMEGWGWQSVHDPAILPTVLEKWGASIATGRPFEMVFPIRGADGVFHSFLTRANPLHGPNGKILRWVGNNTDITGQIRAEALLVALEEKNKQLRELSGRLLRSQDDERRRLARDLHDSVGQLLAALTMNMGVVLNQIDNLTPDAAAAVIQNKSILKHINEEIRTISHLLHPPLLKECGILPALRSFAQGFAERSNIKVSLDLPEVLDDLPEGMDLAIFRIVQECLTNVYRHSGSPTALIRVATSPGQISIQVQDQGKGMPSGKSGQLQGVGLSGIQERVREFGGTVEIQSSEKGTIITANLPCASENNATAPPLDDVSSHPQLSARAAGSH